MKRVLVIFSLLLVSFMARSAFAAGEKVLFVTANHGGQAKVALLNALAESASISIEHQSSRALVDLDKAATVFSQYDLVIFDAVNVQATEKSFMSYAGLVNDKLTRFVAIKAPDMDALRHGISGEQAKQLYDYYDNGGEDNFVRMVAFLKHHIFDNDTTVVAKPIIYPQAGFYHPDYGQKIFSSLEEYKTWLSKRPVKTGNTVGLLIARGAVEAVQTDVIDQTIYQLEQQDVTVMPVFYESGAKPDDYLHLLQENGDTVVDVFINFKTMHYATKRRSEFEALGRPVIQALVHFEGNQKVWEASEQGISPNMMPFTLVLPEASGVIDPIVVAAVDRHSGGSGVIDYQLDYLIERTLNYAKLVDKANKDKKLTVMFWGDRDMGASFLNVPDSLHTISHRLHDEGYQVEPYEHDYYSGLANRILDPFFRDYELDALLKDDLADLLPMADYRQWLSSLPDEVVTEITAFWGEPEQNFMVVERDGQPYFVIPRIRNGNVIIMRQPPRGDNKDQEQTLYHTKTIPVNHYYLAAYFYAKSQWGSDAFIHLGTHGSQEYLPGKERGLSRYDGGNLAVGSVPVMYPFIVDDVGEAMQTKRRGSAVVISHMTPPYAAAGLQGVTADIHELMHQYNALDEGGVKEKTGAQIIVLCVEESLCKDFGWDEAKIKADFKGFLTALHDYMGELAAENQPLGLHSFGELAEPNLVISTVVQMLGKPFIELANEHESDFYRAGQQESHHHDDHDKQAEHSHPHDSESNDGHDDVHGDHFHESESELTALSGFKTIRDFVVDHGHVSTRDLSDLGESMQSFVKTGRQYYQQMLAIQELDSLVVGLAGGYIPVKTGGDPVRHPDSLPTGLNLYGFDPARLPAKAAYDQGEELVEKMIADYYVEHQRYPSKMAFSLWSIESMRHYGVLESQAMKAMGVRPVWSPDGRVVDTEIIPASELKRPRVDVVLSATGLYRDAFPNVMLRLAKAIKQVAELKEDNNSLWENSQKVKAELMADGIDEQEAQYLSTVRIFSSASGQYGSGVNGPVFNSDTWESDSKISDNYLAKMGYAFGADEQRWGQSSAGLYGKQLSGTEVVAFSRSSNLYGMLTSDDPFEYFGSLALAIRNLDGKSPEMMISNLRDAKNGKMEKASTFLAKELRTRNFNKRWIEEMQKEGYSGAVVMASNVANFWGWQVVDPNLVRDDQWQEFFEVYVQDKLELDINDWFEKMNPGAQAQLLERMLEAVRKDYWQADAAVLQEMIERYEELVSNYDLFVDNEKLREFVNKSAAGFGLNMQLPAPISPVMAAAMPINVEQVQGQKLEKVEQVETESEQDMMLYYVLFAGLALLIVGAVRQARYKARL